MTENYLKEVRNQYEEFPYPSVNPEDEKTRLCTPMTEELTYISHYCYGGMKDMRDNCRFLVAGGGTGDAVIGLAEQLRDYKAEIVYVDLSAASQRIARERARIRGLEDRVQWHQGSLLSVAEMGIGQFDYVNASGVLHHLAIPEDGLKALVSVMKPDGVLGCMLYAKYGRMAVYQMQEALRLINHSATSAQEKVDNGKIILNAIPSTNWLVSSPPPVLQEIKSGDAGIYDLLLHSQDRAYTILELYNFMRGAGLEIAQLYSDDIADGRKLYDPGSYIKEERLLAEVYKLPLKKQQQVAELMNGKIIKHTFHAVRKTVPLPSIENADMVPFLKDSFPPFIYEDLLDLVAQSDRTVVMQPKGEKIIVHFPKTPHLSLLIKYFDGKRSMGELMQLVKDAAADTPTDRELLREFGIFYNVLHEYNWIFLRHKSIPPYEFKANMQERVTKMHA